MKDLYKYLCIILVFSFVVFPLFVFAGIGASEEPKMPIHLWVYAVSFVVLIFGTILLTNIVKNYLLKVNGFLAQFTSCIVALALCFIGWVFQAGMFSNTNWRMFIVYGVLLTFTSNGVRSWLKNIPIKISFNEPTK